MWTIGIVTELQRSEIIDLRHLLHLPVSLRDVFLLNYFASHLSFSLAMLLPGMLGLTIGLAIGHGPAMLLLLPLVLGFFFMITAWTYCLRGWLAALMINKRRRRAVIMGITMAFVLLGQLPNLLMNVWGNDKHTHPSEATLTDQEQTAHHAKADERKFAMLDQVHQFVPFLWLPHGARSLTDGKTWPAVWGALGMFLLGTWGLARAYSATRLFYQGGNINKPAQVPPAVPIAKAAGKLLVERTLPIIPEGAAALAFANFRSLSRAPEVKMALAMNVLIFAILGSGMLLRRMGALPATLQPFMAGIVVAVTFFGVMQLMFNHFGFDRSGFRTLVLLPTPHWHILLGNFVAIISPYHIAAGTLRPTRTKGMTQLLVMVSHLLFPLALLPIFVPPGLGLLCDYFNWLPGAAVTLACAILLAVLLYWRTLEPLGRLLQRREQGILQVVTQEVE